MKAKKINIWKIGKESDISFSRLDDVSDEEMTCLEAQEPPLTVHLLGSKGIKNYRRKRLCSLCN